MPSAMRRRSVSDMQHADAALPAEYDAAGYLQEVLQLEEGQTESLFDKILADAAEELGILVPKAAVGSEYAEHPTWDSADPEHGTSCYPQDESAPATLPPHDRLAGPPSPQMSRRPASSRKGHTFSDYDKYLTQLETSDFLDNGIVAAPLTADPAPSLFSVSSRRSYSSIKEGLKTRLKLRRHRSSLERSKEDFKKSKELHTLPCSHNYCDQCLRIVVSQASTDETKMPPRCCGKPIPATIIKPTLSREEQAAFLKSLAQFSTPWDQRIYCPSSTCGEFIPTQCRVDPKCPFEVACPQCRSKACSRCKRAAHGDGQDCPADLEADRVIKMGNIAGWKRCYKCKTMVELAQGCSHITCRCKAQFCYICGAAWDPVVGCPNYCNGEEELERRRLAEEARLERQAAEELAKKESEEAEAAEQTAAEQRTADSQVLTAMQAQHLSERQRFTEFERKMKWLMWTRHGEAKLVILAKYGELQKKMKERHARTAAHLEDRQVAAEMELRATLKQSERGVEIRLKHMEAYCDGLGRSANGANPARVVTERDLRELGQQYNLQADLERLHQAKINVMRDKQAKQMESLMHRQDEDMAKLGLRQSEELDTLVDELSLEEEGLNRVFGERKARLRRRWKLAEDVERKKLEVSTGLRYASLKALEWPTSVVVRQDEMEVLVEED